MAEIILAEGLIVILMSSSRIGSGKACNSIGAGIADDGLYGGVYFDGGDYINGGYN